MPTNRQIRVGIIGCGQFMSRQHIQTVGRSPILKLQHLSTRNAEKLNAIDGNRATVCAVSAQRSMDTGQSVSLEPRDWLGQATMPR
jgi:predicted dehydrogenase